MDQLTRLWNSMTPAQRISLLVVPALLIGGVLGFLRWKHDSSFRVLYSGLAPEDAAAVTTKMREAGIEFRLDATGSSVLVSAEKVAEARLALAGAGMPRSGRIGFEIFDRANLGASDFAEQVNYQRALEGELERTVALLADVESARIHLTFARESVFLESRQPGKATVVVRLKKSGQIAPGSVTAIASLVASAVEGLGPDAISIIDGNGRLLNRPRTTQSGDTAAAAADMGYRQALEAEMLQRINVSLEPLLGPGKFRAGVSIDCDFTATEENEEIWDSAKSAVLTSQTSEESNNTAGAGGAAGTQSNLPRPAPRATGSSSGLLRKTENVTYQPGHLIRKTVAPRGAIRKVYASVLVDQTVRWEGSGPKASRVLTPPSAEVLKGVRDIVATITGFTEQRGDQLTIESLPFESTLMVEPPAAPAPQKGAPAPNPLQQPMLIGGAAVIVLLGAGTFLFHRLGSSRKANKGRTSEAESPAALPPSSDPAHAPGAAGGALATMGAAAAAVHREEASALLGAKVALPEATTATEGLAGDIRSQIEQSPAVAANILRSWINEGMEAR